MGFGWTEHDGLVGGMNAVAVLARHEAKREGVSGVAAVRRAYAFARRCEVWLRVPQDTIVGIQEMGFTLAHVATLLEMNWKCVAHAFAKDAETVHVLVHQVTMDGVLRLLQKDEDDRAYFVPAPGRLCVALRNAWRNRRGDDASEFLASISLSRVLMERYACSEEELDALFSASANGTIEVLIGALESELMTKRDALAIVRHNAFIGSLGTRDGAAFVLRLIELRDRVAVPTVLQTATVIGVEAALACHAHARSSHVAVRAEELRVRHGVSRDEYLSRYGALAESCGCSFRAFVEFTEHWHPATVGTIAAAVPDPEWLIAITRVRLASVLSGAVEQGVPPALLRLHGTRLLEFLAPMRPHAYHAAALAYDRLCGHAPDARAFLALPDTLQDDPAAQDLAREHPALLRDPSFFAFAVAVASGDVMVDPDVLRALAAYSTWRSRKHRNTVYRLALHFRAMGVADADEAIRCAAFEYHELTPRERMKCARDLGYFKNLRHRRRRA